MTKVTLTAFGYSVDLDIEKWQVRIDDFCCDVCDSPHAERWLDCTWVCDDCYQELTLQLSRQHNYTI